MEQQPKKRLTAVIIALILFAIISFFFVSIISIFFIDMEPFGNVAVIPIKGVITVEGASSFGTQAASSTDIIEQIQKADKNPAIEAIVLDINSPGGSAVASKEIADVVKRVNKTTVAVIREVGASGGYWIASATDYIIANEMSVTGSIGVYSSYIEFAGLLERYNMTYQRLVGGAYKDIGDPFKPLGLDERAILQSKINKIHEIFIKAVAENRNMDYEKAKHLSTGEFYLGIEALEFGLIDATGDKETAKQWLITNLELEDIEFAEYKREKTILDMLSGVIAPQSFLIGKGIGSELKNTQKELKIMT
ncbi:signal peptide peptidase SppA [Candidatus Woesearchaeota archaeon]|nr:signal peptide peptidase SppA [Candidatus Woesearchaeota archaeon]